MRFKSQIKFRDNFQRPTFTSSKVAMKRQEQCAKCVKS